MGTILEISQHTVITHLERLNKVHRYGLWMPLNLSEENLAQRVAISSSLLSHHSIQFFLNRIVTEYEKWVTYADIKRYK